MVVSDRTDWSRLYFTEYSCPSVRRCSPYTSIFPLAVVLFRNLGHIMAESNLISAFFFPNQPWNLNDFF